MKATEIAEYIALLLREHEVVMIPNLGGFTAAYAPAHVDQVLGDIRAPRMQIEFDENLAANDGLLTEAISRLSGISMEEAEAGVRAFAAYARETLQKKELLTFPGLGRLRLDYEGKPQFLPDGNVLHPQAFGLPDIRFYPLRQPLAPAAESPAVPGTAPEDAQTTATQHVDVTGRQMISTGAVLIGAILLVTVAAYFIFRPQINALFFSPSTPPELTQPDARVNVPPQTIQPLDELPDQDEEGFFKEEKDEDFDAPTPAPERKPCIIAVGRFKDPANVRRVVDRINQAGFQPFTEPSGELTRVGVQFYYQNEEEIQAMLSSVRSKLEPNAFVFKK